LLDAFDFLGIVLNSSPLVVFGERGVGKTSFLLTLAKSLIQSYQANVFMILREKFDRVPEGVRVIYASNDLFGEEYLGLVRRGFEEISKTMKNFEAGRRIAFLLDDVVPKRLLLAKFSDARLATFLPKVLFWGKILSSLMSAVFIVSTLENIRKGRPFKAKYYLKYGFNFLRVERISRIRRLCLMRFRRKKGRIVGFDKICKNAMLVEGEFIVVETE